LVEAMFLGIINRLLGSIFGIIKYAFLVSTILVIINVINSMVHFLPDQKIRESNLYRPLSAIVPAFFPRIFNKEVPPVNLPNKSKPEKNV
jgi:membrane protein required for colicin V production